MYVVPGVRGMNDRFPLLSTKVQLAPLTFFSVTTRMPWSVPVVMMAQPDTAQPANAAKLMHFKFDKIVVPHSHTKLCTARLALIETINRRALEVLIVVNMGRNNMQDSGASLIWTAN
jgi:hypothetical protein